MTMLFNYEPVGDLDKHKVFTEDDPVKADELIHSGKAIRLDLPKYDELQGKADDLHAIYKKEIEEIKNSDNPLMTADVKAFEVNKLEKQFQEESEAIEAEYMEWRSKQVDEAKVKAATAVVKVSENDRTVASQFATRASLKLTAAFDDDVGAIIHGITNDIKLLTDEQRTALQSEIGGLLEGLSAMDKRTIIDAVQDIRCSDTLSYTVAQQLPRTVLGKKRMEQILKGVVGGGGK